MNKLILGTCKLAVWLGLVAGLVYAVLVVAPPAVVGGAIQMKVGERGVFVLQLQAQRVQLNPQPRIVIPNTQDS